MTYSSRLGSASANAALNAITQAGTTIYFAISLSDPGTSGAGELGGDTRAPVIFGSASGGLAYNTTNVVLTSLPAIDQGVLWCSFWSALTGGTYLFGGVVQGSGAYALPWSSPLSSITISAGSIVVQAL